ncbi:MAG: sigma-70 family RNA polymerase sigma factor [Paenirhodobacter sp.]|uniref:sigma-70 family RNA polymerase sigma factor n=1 Tax=Paenirhodobacter sp. TaxID=1965326 RepID=UPI003D150FC1
MTSARNRHLIEAQIPALRRFAHALARDAALADDLVQECLLRALSRWHLLRSGPELRAWLFRVLRNLYIDTLRRQGRRGGPSLDLVPEPVAPGSAEGAIELTEVLAALWRLPIEQREAILLVGVEGFGYEEAAGIAGVPLGTLMSRLARGRAALRALTGREEKRATPGAPGGLRRVK